MQSIFKISNTSLTKCLVFVYFRFNESPYTTRAVGGLNFLFRGVSLFSSNKKPFLLKEWQMVYIPFEHIRNVDFLYPQKEYIVIRLVI